MLLLLELMAEYKHFGPPNCFVEEANLSEVEEFCLKTRSEGIKLFSKLNPPLAN